MALTLKNAKKLHYELWDWLAEDPIRDKHEWPRWKENGGDIQEVMSHCFACEISNKKNNFYCFLLNASCAESNDNDCLNDLYKKWLRNHNIEYAKQIRDSGGKR